MDQSIYIDTGKNALLHFFPTGAPVRNLFAGLATLLVTAGEATVEIDSRLYTLQAGTLLTLLPSHLLRTTAYDANFQCLTLAFLFEVMTDFPYLIQTCISEKMQRTPSISLTIEEASQISTLHTDIARHFLATTHPSYRQILCAQLFIFTAEVASIYATQPMCAPIGRDEELTDRFFRLLHEHFRTTRTPDFYADRLCVSTKHLSRIIARTTNQPPNYWIADFTIREAKMLLRSSTLTVTELSEQLNFPNSSFFARYFKRFTGVSPSEYRAL